MSRSVSIEVGNSDPREKARALMPTLRERADEIEEARRLPRDLAENFSKSGFYRMLVPEVYGGLEVPPHVAMETIELLARADGASAWCAFIGSTSGTVLASLAPDAAREIFSNPEVRLGGVFAPRGEAHVEGDGFRVNGRWQWGSGTENCDWVMGGCRVLESGKPRVGKKGAPVQKMMIVPAREIEFLDTWHVSGLCGSGSTDFEMKDLFVPASRTVGLGVDRPLDRPLYRFPQFGLLAMGIAAVSLGLARAAIDELVALADAKTPTGSSRALAARASTQSDVSEGYALWRSARAFYFEAIEAAWQSACREGRIGTQERRDIRLATTHATRSCARTVDLMYNLGGGTSVYRKSPLQRIFRDVHVATQHMMVAPPTFELTGRLLLGVEADTTGL
jgi:alkylation response protein AidB-like acyl-CoA dehydrogenase